MTADPEPSDLDIVVKVLDKRVWAVECRDDTIAKLHATKGADVVVVSTAPGSPMSPSVARGFARVLGMAADWASSPPPPG